MVQPDTPSDTDLVVRIRIGDERALQGLVGRYYTRLVDYAADYVGSLDEAEDVVQAAFIKMWELRDTLPDGREIVAYLFGAIRNRALNARRQQRGNTRRAEAVAHEHGDDAQLSYNTGAAEVEEHELAGVIEQAIASLPPRCREVFRLSRDEGLTYQQIAGVLGISAHTVHVQMAKALRLVREKFLERE